MKEDTELQYIMEDYHSLIEEYRLPKLSYLALEEFIEAKKAGQHHIPKAWAKINYPEKYKLYEE